MAQELAEQPDVLQRVLDDGTPRINAVAAEIVARGPRFVLFTARGTSDNAALYGKYLVEVMLGKPAGLSSMSTTTVYGARSDLTGCLVVTVSQSGGSPDLVAAAEAAREAGAITLAVTNTPGSPLAAVCEYHLDVLAGPELALPATKTYTAELLTLYLLVRALSGVDGASSARDIPALAHTVLSGSLGGLAERYRNAGSLLLTSRGFAYPTAREAALKLMETSYIPSLAFSGADLMHGPLAMVDRDTPVIAVVPGGAGGTALQPVLDRLRGCGADLTVIGNPDHVSAVGRGFALPDGVPEELQPLLQILPLQRLAYELAIARGVDPDAPRALAKVTETH
ncbi:SIS domain-containing protein [Streptomyces sp. NBC_00094]|uniref:SIS domain-containing protein n=1 Tax=Streptomyces sp. NBC_00094 TaxID=2903620 RepID=UPI002252FB40|nr:SIS domain-containing protein [Streptomyces sp. NBC_00094]MCX5389102.1 SIS domain-containing protein [Streptomyces sp. NBC_00094]